MVMVNNISGVILAGGANSRFNGIVKANIVIGGRTIISGAVNTLKEIFTEIIIVTNTPEEFTEYADYKIVSDILMNKGPLGGIHAALKAASGEAVFVFAGDMPFPDKDIIVSLLNSFTGNKCEILIPITGDYIEPLHAIYSKSILKNIEDYLEADNKNAIRDFIKVVRTSYLPLEDSEKTRKAFSNINSPDDLAAMEKLMNN